MAASGFRPLRKIPYCCLPWESGPCLSPSVADHPLRPATDHRLGRPLPHQLPNPTRAPPSAINLSPSSRRGACGISRSFPRLSPTKGQVPTRYSPVRHSLRAETPKAFDLHVLGMPPAFVLSQDQTLKFIPDPPKGEPKQGSPNVRILREPWRPLRPPSAHPFPLLHNLKQPSPQGQPPSPPQRGRAYTPLPHPTSTSDSQALRGSHSVPWAPRQTAKVMSLIRPVQRDIDKNLPNNLRSNQASATPRASGPRAAPRNRSSPLAHPRATGNASLGKAAKAGTASAPTAHRPRSHNSGVHCRRTRGEIR